MKEYTIEEQMLIVNACPKIDIEGIRFEYARETFGNDSPGEEICFLTEEGKEAFYSDDGAEGVEVTFYFRDAGVKLDQKYVSFNGFAQIFDPENEEEFNFVCETVPALIIPATANKDGRFAVTVPMFLSKPYEDEEDYNKCLLDVLKEHNALFQFYGVVIANQFAKERIGNISGIMEHDDKEIGVKARNITYCLADEPDNEEDFI